VKSLVITVITASLMLFVQSAWLSRGIILGVIPDLSLSVLLFASFLNKEGQGMLAAFLAGLAADMLSASPLGYNAFLYTVCAYFATLLSRIAERDAFVVPFLLGTAATFIKGVLSLIIAALFSSSVVGSRMLGVEFAVEIAANGIGTIIMFFLLHFAEGLFVDERRKALP